MTWTYINKKNDTKDERSKPITEIEINLGFVLFFLEVTNCKNAKNKDNRSAKFPRKAAIS